MGQCDLIEVDLSPKDFTVELNPVCYDVGIITSQVTLDYGLIAGSGPPGAPGEKGDKGDTGDTGQPGSPGLAAYVTVGTTTTGAPGSSAAVTDSDPSDNATLNFVIPRGDVGPTGPAGQGINIKGTVANHAALPAAGNSPGDVWITSDTGHGWSWNGTTWVDIGPIQGPKGDPGPSNVLTVSSTTTGTPGTNAAVSISGTSPSQSLAFTIPAGVSGSPGSAGTPGAAATIAAGTTTTGAPGSAANVTNAGSSSAAVFNFLIPRGDVGATGNTGPASTVPGPPGPSTPSANAGNLLTTGSDSLLYLPPSAIQPVIWSQTRRVFNSVGNPNFEVDQRSTGASSLINSLVAIDRWSAIRSGGSTLAGTVQQTLGNPAIPGTNFAISSKYWRVTLTTQQASMAATDFLYLLQTVEGPAWRELMSDVHSVSLMVRSSVANLSFGLSLRDGPTTTKSLTKLCNIPTANTWTIISLPNLPVWPAGNFVYTPGAVGYLLAITLAAGSNFMSPANDVWQSAGNVIGAVGQSNFAASPVNSTFDIAFVQHEPGPVCSTLIDKPFSQNLDECLRYYQKTAPYTYLANAAQQAGAIFFYSTAVQNQYFGIAPFKKVMAKVPTVTLTSSATGAANNVRNASTSADLALSANGALNISDSGFNGYQLAVAPAAAQMLVANYAADTGW